MANTHPPRNKKKPLTNSTSSDKEKERPRAKGLYLDPSIPLPNPKEEHFSDLIAQDLYGCDCYLIAVNPKTSRIKAKSQGSKLKVRQDVASRAAWLRANKHSKKKTARPAGRAAAGIPDTPQEEPTTKPPEKTGPLTREEVQAVLASAVRNAVSSTEKTAALKLAREMLSLDIEGATVMSPEAIVQYIASTAGKSHAEIASDLGGVRQMIETVLVFAKVPHSIQQRVIGRMYNSLRATPKDTHTTDTQAGKHLLSDGQSDNSPAAVNDEPRGEVGGIGGGGPSTPPV